MPKVYLALFVILFSACRLFSQAGGTAVPFLTFPASPLSNGMGGASVALIDDGPFAQAINPALIGIAAKTTGASFGFYPGGMDIFGSVNFTNTGFQVGYSFSKIDPGLPLSIGAGYLYQDIDLGEFIRTDESGNVIGKFRSEEWAKSFSLGACYEYWALFGLGFTYKRVDSRIVPAIPQMLSEEASAPAFDFGLFVNAPVLNSLVLINQVRMNGNISLGYTLANIGKELPYRFEKDPLPRTTRIGYGINLNFQLPIKSRDFTALTFDFTAQADDLLVKRDSLGFEYQGIMGDLDVLKNLVTLKNSTGVTIRNGWRVDLMEIIQVFGGGNSFGQIDNNNDEYSTSGFAIHAKGIAKLLGTFTEIKALDYFANHFDLRFHTGKYENSEGTGYKYDFTCLSLVVQNFDF